MFRIAHLVQIKNIFISKTVIRRYIIKPGNKNVLQYQILNYFQNLDVFKTASEQFEVSAQVRKTTIKNDINQEKFQFIRDQINNFAGGPKITKESLNILDEKCLQLINTLTYSQILILLSSLLKILPYNVLMKSQYYKTSMDVLFEALESELLSQQEIVQLLFFISLKKENARSYIHYLKTFLPDFKSLNLIEKCITAEAFYKSSLKLSQTQCRALEQLLTENSKELISNTYMLVPLCKIIRLSKPTNQLNLNNLSYAIINNEQPFNIMVAVNILSLYAEALLNEPNAVARLARDCIQTIARNGLFLRLKDIDRFLWSISYLGFNLEEDEKLILIEVVKNRLQELKKKENIGYLVNSLLSLHMLKCWDPKVIENCFEEKVFEPIYYEKFHWKIRSRLYLLINQINVELNVEVPQPLNKEIHISYSVPEELNAMANILNSLTEQYIVQGVLVHCPIKGLQIPGISLATETCLYHIDLLNNSTCLRNTFIPHGLMKLKSRLLTNLKFHHIFIEEELLRKNSDKIKLIIQEHIRRPKFKF